MRLDCQGLTLTYRGVNGPLSALEEITFTAAEEEFVSIVGPSGCGKTTLLKLVAGLLEPTSGRVEISGVGSDHRPRSALVFQDHGLFPWMSVLDNVAFGLEMRGISRRERQAQAQILIERVGLGRFARSYPRELSAGMQQRVGIVRAFVTDPALLLMDEPFGALDSQTRLLLQEELLRIWREQRKLVLFVTHDIDEAVRLSDRILVMSGRPGRILENITVPIGRPRDLRKRETGETNDLRWHIWTLLEREVRQGLWMAE